jgi:hypothetical protein
MADMNAELVLPLVGFVLVLGGGLLWIALDSETVYIFDVFGKSFDYMWRESGRRWKYTLMYGWRLVAVLLFVGTGVSLAWLLVNSIGWNAATVALFIMMSAATVGLIRWIKIAGRLRYQRMLRNAATALTPVAKRFVEIGDIRSMMDDAGYQSEPNWSAWHPRSIKEWPAVVPVAYVHAPPSAAVLFPVDWRHFLAWKLGNQLSLVGSVLPFNGPCGTSFVLRGVWALRDLPDWSIVQAELRLDDASMDGVNQGTAN